jgi:hypothetical protein
MKKQQFYHGTRVELSPGELLYPDNLSGIIYLSPNLDEAIWDAELAVGESTSRVYMVEPLGQIENVSNLSDRKSLGHPSMSCYSREPLRIISEVTQWSLYHGTRADLKPGDLIEPGYKSNYGKRTNAAYVYLTRTLDAATWGAELAVGDSPGRIYIVEPTGSIEDDPNLTNMKFRGNPTKSFRSREPIRVVGEIKDWQGHSAEAIKAMKDGLKRLEQADVEP